MGEGHSAYVEGSMTKRQSQAGFGGRDKDGVIPRGVHAILYALFDSDERLDRAAMRRQVEI